MTSEDIALAAQAANPQGELAIVKGSEEPDLVLAAFALPTTQSMFSSIAYLATFSQ